MGTGRFAAKALRDRWSAAADPPPWRTGMLGSADHLSGRAAVCPARRALPASARCSASSRGPLRRGRHAFRQADMQALRHPGRTTRSCGNGQRNPADERVPPLCKSQAQGRDRSIGTHRLLGGHRLSLVLTTPSAGRALRHLRQFQVGISSVLGLRNKLGKTIPKRGGHTCRVDLNPSGSTSALPSPSRPEFCRACSATYPSES